MGLTTVEPSCETAYLEVIDKGNNDARVKFCDKSHQGKKYEFSSNIELVLSPGEWGLDVYGFQIIYEALKNEDEETKIIDEVEPTESILKIGSFLKKGPAPATDQPIVEPKPDKVTPKK